MKLQTLSVHFFPLDKQEVKNQFPVYCRIIIDRKKAEFFTGQRVALNKWDSNNSRIKGNPEASGVLSVIENNIRMFYNKKMLEGVSVSARDCKDFIKGKGEPTTGLIEYINRFIGEMIMLPDQYSNSTIKIYRTLSKHLAAFLATKRMKEIQMAKVNLQMLNEFELYLRTQLRLNTNSTTKYLKQMKSVFNRANQFGLTKNDPYKGYKFKHEKVNRTFLTKMEIESLENLPSLNQSLQHVLDCFLMGIYTGMRYSDIQQLTSKHIRTDKEKNQWIELDMVKTGDRLSIPLLEKAAGILKKHEMYAEQTGKLLPVISNQKINSYLKVLGDLAGIDKPLTFHVARHTFATTITLSNKVPLEIVSKLLGHSSIDTTQIYAKITNDYLLETSKTLNKILE